MSRPAAIAPTLPIHGSTQMTLTESRGIEFVRQFGVQRVVLADRLSRRRRFWLSSVRP